MPMQDRGPFVNATIYFDSSLASGPNHLSGRNFSGSGKMFGLSWTARTEMETTLCFQISTLLEYNVSGETTYICG